MLERATLAWGLALLGAGAPLFAGTPGFMKVGAMSSGRYSAAAVTLLDGSVLVASDATIERYDPALRTFSVVGPLTTNRGSGLTMTVLSDGKVLIAGGQAVDASQQSAEIFDPETGASTATGDMSVPRSFHAATLLSSGRVLVTGGHQYNHPFSALDSAEIFDPQTGKFEPVQQPMGSRRQDHTATLLANGQVLVAGGFVDMEALSAAEIFDPATGTFTPTGSLASGRGNHSANLLGDGRVVVIGGHGGIPGASLDTAEAYDPGSGTFAPAGAMSVARGAHTTTTLANGALLVVGGFTAYPFTGSTLAGAEIYDPSAESFTPTASLHEARGRHLAALLQTGEVLVAGGLGQCCGGGLQSAELFSSSLVDTRPPVVTVPADITVVQDSPQGAVVNYAYSYPPPSASDDVDPAPSLECLPVSGSTFPVGVTTVVCTATDASGNQGTGQFRVTVLESLSVPMTIDAQAKVDPRTGLATLSGTVACNRTTQGYIGLDLSQTDGRTTVQGSASRYFRCVPPSFEWFLSVSASSGRFRGGAAQARLSGSFCAFDCASTSVERAVRLVAGQAGGGEFPLAKVVDRATRMPGSRSTFGSFGLPFVRNGVVVFQGYGPTLSEAGLYSSQDGRLAVIADTRTPIPGGTGTFTVLDSLAFDGVSAVFQGQDSAGGAGLYKSSAGVLARVADSATPVPGDAGTFRGFIGPVVAGNRMAFRGSNDNSAWGTFGVYSVVGRTLRRIADLNTAVPGGTGNFGVFGTRPVLDGDSVVFPAFSVGYGQSGIYASRNGGLGVVADTSTPIPGGSGSFFGFGAPASSGGVVAFTAFDSSYRQGLYRSDAGVLRKVVDAQTSVPGRAATFGYIDLPVVENGSVFFGAVTSTYEPAGLYASRSSGLFVIADLSTPVPGGQGVFNGFNTRPLVAASSVAFVGTDSSGSSGIYVRRYGVLHKVISDADPLDGKAVGFLQLAAGESCDYAFCTAGYGTGFDGSKVAFLVQFADGSQAIYVASLDARRP